MSSDMLEMKNKEKKKPRRDMEKNPCGTAARQDTSSGTVELDPTNLVNRVQKLQK